MFPVARPKARHVAHLILMLSLAACADNAHESAEDEREPSLSSPGSSNSGAQPGSPSYSSDDDGEDEESAEPPLGPTPGMTSARDAGKSAPQPESPASQPSAPEPNQVAISPFVDTTRDPFSTFGADVDSASYDYLRQGLTQTRVLPRPDYVRVEDYVNYFKYAYPVPAADGTEAFSISLAASAHPLGRATTLLRVGIQAKAAPVLEKRAAHVVFLVDVSGSMSSQDKLPLVKRVLEESLSVLSPTDHVSIVTYAGDTRVRLAPTAASDKPTIVNVVRQLEAGGGTNGASGINLAYEQASTAFVQGGINHVILCTDGDFNLGVTSNDALVQLIRQKRETGVTLTALGFGRDNLNDAMMEKVSNAGNGMYSLVYSEDQALQYANQKLLSTVSHVAKDMKIQVEFNPLLVSAYRLLGYENRAIADGSFRDDRVDGGEVGAEHRVTALYELVLQGSTPPAPTGAPALSVGEASDLLREIAAGELVRVKVRSKAVTATDATPASEVMAALSPVEVSATADPDSAWAASLAGFAELLRQSPYASLVELDAIERIASSQKERDADRAEFVQLLTAARPLIAARRPPSP